MYDVITVTVVVSNMAENSNNVVVVTYKVMKIASNDGVYLYISDGKFVIKLPKLLYMSVFINIPWKLETFCMWQILKYCSYWYGDNLVYCWSSWVQSSRSQIHIRLLICLLWLSGTINFCLGICRNVEYKYYCNGHFVI